MHAHALQAFQHDRPFAQKVMRYDGLSYIPELARWRIDSALQDRASLRYENHDVAIGRALHALNQQLRRDGIDKIGKQDYQRPSLQPCVELSQSQCEVRLVVLVFELGRRSLDPSEAGDPTNRS